ncbi:uncharacterized protein LOC134196637 [Corticium candelabrum]|uniref:uncharacterized protein LOC134196637 n=1 Tax=Corticium candelabrum TaxID=121492 RepID=UPI002E256A1A|nr:uncharacterized protein LOC134196637 [Corticium candelabrum]
MNSRKRHRKNYEYETSKPTSAQNLDEFATELAQTAQYFAIVDEEGPYDQDDCTCTWKADLVEELDTLTRTSKRKFQKFADEIKQRAKAVVAAEAKLGKKRRKVEDDIKQMQQRLKDEKKSMKNVYKFQCSQVKLNVGGHKFSTSLTTLRSQPDSMLAVMFSGRHQLATDEDGAYFIDRDGTHYRHILNYLRDDTNLEVTLPQTKREQTELFKEAQYCQLNKLETRIWKMMLPRVTQEQLNMYFINNHGNMYNHQYQYNYFSTASNYDRYRNQTVRQTSTTMSLDEHDLSGLNFSKTHFFVLEFPSKDHVCNKLTSLGAGFKLIVLLIFRMLIYQKPIFKIVKVSPQEESISKEPY